MNIIVLWCLCNVMRALRILSYGVLVYHNLSPSFLTGPLVKRGGHKIEHGEITVVRKVVRV